MDEIFDLVLPDEYARALPGERVTDPLGASTTATNDYRWMYGELFRRFVWSSDPVAPAPGGWPKGEWFAVRGHWKQFKKKAAA